MYVFAERRALFDLQHNVVGVLAAEAPATALAHVRRGSVASRHDRMVLLRSKTGASEISGPPFLEAGAESALHADEWRPFALFEKRHLTPDSLWLRFTTTGRRPAVRATRVARCVPSLHVSVRNAGPR